MACQLSLFISYCMYTVIYVHISPNLCPLCIINESTQKPQTMAEQQQWNLTEKSNAALQT